MYNQTVFISKITKIGNSHGITIPQNILNAYNWTRGDVVIFGFAGGDQLYIKRITDKELEQLKPKGPLSI